MLLQLFFFSIYSHTFAEDVAVFSGEKMKCYSCSSAMLHSRWPKDEDTNRLQFLSDFPWFSNESCDSISSALPVVDCSGSVCIKAVIKEPPAKRDVCVESGAIVRDCWSRVMKHADILEPITRNNLLGLSLDGLNTSEPVGFIYTCKGSLCNKSTTIFSLSAVIFVIFYLL